ncbi:unnamed protein product, partial [Linum tenue]
MDFGDRSECRSAWESFRRPSMPMDHPAAVAFAVFFSGGTGMLHSRSPAVKAPPLGTPRDPASWPFPRS